MPRWFASQKLLPKQAGTKEAVDGQNLLIKAVEGQLIRCLRISLRCGEFV